MSMSLYPFLGPILKKFIKHYVKRLLKGIVKQDTLKESLIPLSMPPDPPLYRFAKEDTKWI